MIPIPLPEIRQCLESVGALQVTVQEDKDTVMILSLFTIRHKPTGIFLMVSEVGGQALFQLFTTFDQAFEKPGVDFYEVLDKLNTKLTLGHLQAREQEGDWRITYRSNFVGDPDALFANHCFRNFITFSVDMVGGIDKELA